MQTFYLTFGQRSPLKNGWVEIEANDMEHAQDKAIYAFGDKFSQIYPEKNFNKKLFWRKRLGEIIL